MTVNFRFAQEINTYVQLALFVIRTRKLYRNCRSVCPSPPYGKRLQADNQSTKSRFTHTFGCEIVSILIRTLLRPKNISILSSHDFEASPSSPGKSMQTSNCYRSAERIGTNRRESRTPSKFCT